MKGISHLILPLCVWHFCSYGINTNSKILQGSLKSYDRRHYKIELGKFYSVVTLSQNVLAICDYMQNVFSVHW